MKWGYISAQKLVSVQKIVLCPFQCKPRPSGVSLEFPGLESMPQVPGIGAEVDQIHNARNVVLATVSVLKSSVPIFRPTSYKVSVQKVLLCPFHFKTRPSGLSLTSKDCKISPKFREIHSKFVKITIYVRQFRLLFQS